MHNPCASGDGVVGQPPATFAVKLLAHEEGQDVSSCDLSASRLCQWWPLGFFLTKEEQKNLPLLLVPGHGEPLKEV